MTAHVSALIFHFYLIAGVMHENREWPLLHKSIWRCLFRLWTGLWSSGELGRGKSEKACRQTFVTAVPRHQMAVHQILMQVLIGQNTDCWLVQVRLTSASWSARCTRFDHKVAITKYFKDCYACSKAITNGGTIRSSQKTRSIFRQTLSWSLSSHNAILHSWCSFGLSCTLDL